VKTGKQNASGAVKQKSIEEVSTPGLSTVKDISGALKVESQEIIKTLLYVADDQPVAVLLRGDHEANETKIKNYLNAKTLELADEKKVQEITGGALGFSGPMGLKVKIVADNSIKNIANAVTGANEKDKHLRNVNLDRDFKVSEWIDARVIDVNDPCPKCAGEIKLKNAIELGHTFKLGTKYSDTLNAMFLNANGSQKPVIMGCYGIGVNRILASVIETSHDKDGIIWPVGLSPYEVVVVPVKKDDKETADEADRIYGELTEAGVDVMLDDREKSPGVKFKDADLVGFPIQVVVGPKSLQQKKVELKNRATGEKELVDKDKVLESVEARLKK